MISKFIPKFNEYLRRMDINFDCFKPDVNNAEHDVCVLMIDDDVPNSDERESSPPPQTRHMMTVITCLSMISLQPPRIRLENPRILLRSLRNSFIHSTLHLQITPGRSQMCFFDERRSGLLISLA